MIIDLPIKKEKAKGGGKVGKIDDPKIYR